VSNLYLNWLFGLIYDWLLFFRDEHLDNVEGSHQTSQIIATAGALSPTQPLSAALEDLFQRTTVLVIEERNDPPPDPEDGDLYLIGTAPTGDWTGNPQFIARWSAGEGSYWYMYQPGPSFVLVPTSPTSYRVLVTKGNNEWVEFIPLGGPSESFPDSIVSLADDTVLTEASRYVLGSAKVDAHVTFTLPSAVMAKPHPITVTRLEDGFSSYKVKVVGDGVETVQGTSVLELSPGQSYTLIPDGVSDWRIG